MTQTEFTYRRVKRKPIYPKPCSIYQHRGRTINNIPRSYLLVPRLQKIFHGARLAKFSNSPVNAKDCSNRDICINITAAIQWIKQHYILTLIIQLIIKKDDIIFFL